jgi:hypothetical protein
MAEGKKTFIFYSDWINMVREMPNEDAGELLKHILSYVNDENPETKNILVKMAFGHMKPVLKKDLKKWDEIREKRKEAGAKGGKANAKQIEANAKQLEAVNDNVNVDTMYLSDEKCSEKQFLEDWAKCRQSYLKVPTNIKKLKTFDIPKFNNAVKDYSREQLREAMRGLFFQEVISFSSMTLQPSHFLENVDKYYNAFISKDRKLYGSKPVEQ